jgi:hypothetical protein
MFNSKILIALAAVTGLAACASNPPEPMVSLLDSTGTALTSVPASSVAGVPPGTALRIDVNGRQETVTVGPRVSPATSAVTVMVGQTRRDGSPVLTYAGPGQGDLAPAGTPVFQDGRTGRGGRPFVAYEQAPASR